MEPTTEDYSLPDNVHLSGFRDVDEPTMKLLHKKLHHHLKKFGEVHNEVDEIKVRLKTVHQREKSEKYEVHVAVFDGSSHVSAEETDRNIIAAVDNACQRALKSMR